MGPSVAAGHLEEFEARSTDMMKNHVSSTMQWKLLDGLYGSGLTLLRPASEAVLVGMMLWVRTGMDWVALWAGAVLVSIAGRAMLRNSYRTGSDRIGTKEWARRYIVSSCVESALWGAISALILLMSDPVVHMIVAAALGNKLCDAVTHSSGEPRAGLGQVMLMLVPLALCCFATLQPVYVGYGGLTVIQIVAASMRIRHLHRQTTGLLSANATVETTNARLEQANRKLAALATTDPLTKLSNRSGFDAALRREWGRAIREHRALTVMLIHVDQLSSLNEDSGAAAGDECLRRIADALQLTLRRTTDLPARYGVEEFAVVLPDTDRVAAHYLGDRICAAIATLGISHGGADSGKVTVSIGHSTVIPAEVLVPMNLVGQADTALHRAKASGRGCSCAWDHALDSAGETGAGISLQPAPMAPPATLDQRMPMGRLLPRAALRDHDDETDAEAEDASARSGLRE